MTGRNSCLSSSFPSVLACLPTVQPSLPGLSTFSTLRTMFVCGVMMWVSMKVTPTPTLQVAHLWLQYSLSHTQIHCSQRKYMAVTCRAFSLPVADITKMPRWSNAFITGNNKLPNLFLISTVHTLLRVAYTTPTHHKVGNPPSPSLPFLIHGGRKWKSGSERAGEQRTWIRLGPYVSNSCHTNEVPSQLCIPVCHIRQMNYCQTLISLSS